MINIHFARIKYISILITALMVLALSTGYPQKLSSFFNLTTRINTAGDDYAPSLTMDGSTAVFNSQMPGEKSHNIFICKNKNGSWGDPYPVFNINSDANEETPFISADGKTIIFASDRPGGLSPSATSDGKKRITFDLYISRLIEGKWTEPEMLKGPVNTNMNERAPGLSSDGETLFFTRWPYNNPGKAKIYKAKLDGGIFTGVEALPEIINSGNYEIGFRPSYKSGGYYFASRRAGGYGGWDIYYTKLSGKNFSTPVNAGRGINTSYDDMYYSESKINSIICSDRTGGYGKFDLYSSLPAVKAPAASVKSVSSVQSTILNLTVKDKTSKKTLNGNLFRILLLGEREKETVFLRKIEIKSGSKGNFTLNPKDDVDTVVIEPLSKKYSPCSVKIKVIRGTVQDITLMMKRMSRSDKKSGSCIETVIKSSDVKAGSGLPELPYLRTIYYKFDSSGIPTEYIPEIHTLVDFMRNNPGYSITISGYTDASGSAKVNETLSMKRAQNVADLLKSLDVDESRIEVKWYGELKALSGNTGPRYYTLDRRVELLLVKK